MNLILKILSFIFPFPRQTSGEFTLAPSEGEVYIKLEYEPMECNVWFVDEDGDGIPTCVELNDLIYEIRMLPRGIKFKYILESNIRRVQWTARRYGWGFVRPTLK